MYDLLFFVRMIHTAATASFFSTRTAAPWWALYSSKGRAGNNNTTVANPCDICPQEKRVCNHCDHATSACCSRKDRCILCVLSRTADKKRTNQSINARKLGPIILYLVHIMIFFTLDMTAVCLCGLSSHPFWTLVFNFPNKFGAPVGVTDTAGRSRHKIFCSPPFRPFAVLALFYYEYA